MSSFSDIRVTSCYDLQFPFIPPAVEFSTSPSRDQLVEHYWMAHPRFRFVKYMTPLGGRLLDLGAGSGGLVDWKIWLAPDRSDLQVYGVDLRTNEHEAKYAGFAVSNLDTDPIPFEGVQFDSLVMSHVLEHLKDPVAMIGSLRNRIVPGGYAYLEVPSPASQELPKAEDFRAQGWPMMISNFFDDSTHLQTIPLPAMRQAAEAAGFRLVESGVIANRLLADVMIDYAHRNNDQEIMLYGYWLATGWAHYVLVQNPSYWPSTGRSIA